MISFDAFHWTIRAKLNQIGRLKKEKWKWELLATKKDKCRESQMVEGEKMKHLAANSGGFAGGGGRRRRRRIEGLMVKMKGFHVRLKEKMQIEKEFLWFA